MESNVEVFHCIIIFNHQQEPIFSIYDDYFQNTVISPNRNVYETRSETISVDNLLMQLFSPILASQSAMVDTMKTKFTIIDLYENQTFVFRKVHDCSIIILLSEKCLFRHQTLIINSKIDLIEWLISSFYGLCWNQMKFNNNQWLKVLLREMWLLDKTEFNLTFGSIERIDLSFQMKLNERVLEVLVNNSRYLRQVNEKRLKHQLILVGSKLFCLFTNTESLNNLSAKDNLLFVLICNAIFNRFSRAREMLFSENSAINEVKLDRKLIRCISREKEIIEKKTSSSSSTEEFSSADSDFTNLVKTSSTTVKLCESSDNNSNISVKGFDPFVLGIENKDNHRYKIVRIFLTTAGNLLTPCHLHLIKLTRNVIYIGVEEDVDNNVQIPTLDKSIRFLRKLLMEHDKTEIIPLLKTRISQAVDKLHYLGTIHSQKLRHTFRMVISSNSTNSNFLESLIKELLRTFESIYCHYYISYSIVGNEKLCKSFLRCFLSVKKEMTDFFSILSMKAVQNLSPTSFYPLYPGMVHFIVKTRKLHNSLICPAFDRTFLSDYNIQKLHILVDLCQKIVVQLDLSPTWRQIEICDKDFRCTYMKRKYKVLEDKYQEFELTVFHLSEVCYSLVKKQMTLLMNQFLTDHGETDTPLLDLMS